ncbi:hypothetical protein K488DRAFT_78023 [Vararia minispora EC-137]|uniref:Uncharacterized protein n=1 Tax=Vararia minispora EC-137 TaxID=1314806 RepID=A0ACB8QNU8_9AGAM|nr:hypothetical protein K488DRAFT_78023 [Vararia minispora EC-137]
MPRKESSTMPASAQAQQDAVSEGIEKLELPRSIVMRLAKSAVPEGTKLQKDTVTALVKGSTVFVNYLGAPAPVYAANDVSQSKQHKSVSASDVLKALEMVDFPDLVQPLQQELKSFKAKRARAGEASAVTNPTPRPSKLGRPKKSASASVDAAPTAASVPPPPAGPADGDAEMDDGAPGSDPEDDDDEQVDEDDSEGEPDEEQDEAEDIEMGVVRRPELSERREETAMSSSLSEIVEPRGRERDLRLSLSLSLSRTRVAPTW